MKYFSDNEQGMPPCTLTEINVDIWNVLSTSLYSPNKGSGSSRAREFHPHPLTEPCVKVSPHTALHTQRFVHRHNLGV